MKEDFRPHDSQKGPRSFFTLVSWCPGFGKVSRADQHFKSETRNSVGWRLSYSVRSFPLPTSNAFKGDPKAPFHTEWRQIRHKSHVHAYPWMPRWTNQYHGADPVISPRPWDPCPQFSLCLARETCNQQVVTTQWNLEPSTTCPGLKLKGMGIWLWWRWPTSCLTHSVCMPRRPIWTEPSSSSLSLPLPCSLCASACHEEGQKLGFEMPGQ